LRVMAMMMERMAMTRMAGMGWRAGD
jgi:hypothetical protein